MKTWMPLLLLLGSLQLNAQKKDTYYVFDAQWKPVPLDSAKFMIHVQKQNDSCWQLDYYNFLGPIIKTEHYADKEATILNGSVAYYDDKGYLDSTGNYTNGKREGYFYRLQGDSMRAIHEYVYANDRLVSEKDLTKKVNSGPPKKEDAKESEYQGSLPKWMRYLNKNLHYPERALQNHIQGEVRVIFCIDTEGNVKEPRLAHSVEYSLDEEALRIIAQSGKWTPAILNDKKVKSYKTQPIVFRF